MATIGSAILRVNSQLLLEALRLPANVRLDAAQMSFHDDGVVELRISGPDLPPVREGERLRWVNAIFRDGVFERFE